MSISGAFTPTEVVDSLSARCGHRQTLSDGDGTRTSRQCVPVGPGADSSGGKRSPGNVAEWVDAGVAASASALYHQVAETSGDYGDVTSAARTMPTRSPRPVGRSQG